VRTGDSLVSGGKWGILMEKVKEKGKTLQSNQKQGGEAMYIKCE